MGDASAGNFRKSLGRRLSYDESRPAQGGLGGQLAEHPAAPVETMLSIARQPSRGAQPHWRPAELFEPAPSLIAVEWFFMAPAMAFSLALAALLAWSFPPATTLYWCAAAILLSLASPQVRRLEAHQPRNLAIRICTLLVIVALPMFALGHAIAHWGLHAGLPWQISLGVLIVCTSLATVIQNGKAPGLFAAQIACWGAVAFVEGSFTSLVVLVCSTVFAGLISCRQMRLARIERAKDFERARIRNRAEDILNEYEETGQGWFWETDRRGLLTYVSHAVARVLGRGRAENLLACPFIELFDLDASGLDGERTLSFHLSARSSFKELAVRAAASEERWWSISGSPIYDEFGNFVGYRGSGTDLTERKRSQDKASRLAHYDSLTGLANRFQMSQSLDRILQAPLEQHRVCAVLLLDLDRFKQVNDTLGHPAGDALLKQVAKRLESAVGDYGRVGRLGGDEFQVIVPGKLDRDQLASLAQQIINIPVAALCDRWGSGGDRGLGRNCPVARSMG